MPTVVIRNLSPETHRALQARAVQHGRSTEAEVHAILDEAARLFGQYRDNGLKLLGLNFNPVIAYHSPV